jgi:hypothetical protein
MECCSWFVLPQGLLEHLLLLEMSCHVDKWATTLWRLLLCMRYVSVLPVVRLQDKLWWQLACRNRRMRSYRASTSVQWLQLPAATCGTLHQLLHHLLYTSSILVGSFARPAAEL